MTKKKTRARQAPPPEPPPPPLSRAKQIAQRQRADHFKRFHVAVTLAPVFASAFIRAGGPGKLWMDYEDLAESVVFLADAIARRLDRP